MKKLIIVLMVVAVASFLFVGCLPDTVTPVTPTEPVTPTAAKTDTPYITDIGGISLYSTDTQYTGSLLTDGVGVANAIIKLYIDDVQVGVGTTGDDGTFAEIGATLSKVTEGVRVVYVTATAPGLAESDASTKYTLTYDYTAPALASAVADSSDNTITVTFSEDVLMPLSTDTSGTSQWSNSALNPANWEVNSTALSTFASGVTVAKLTDKKVRFYCGTGTIDTNSGYFIEAINVLDIALNDMPDAAVNVGVTAIATP